MIPTPKPVTDPVVVVLGVACAASAVAGEVTGRVRCACGDIADVAGLCPTSGTRIADLGGVDPWSAGADAVRDLILDALDRAEVLRRRACADVARLHTLDDLETGR